MISSRRLRDRARVTIVSVLGVAAIGAALSGRLWATAQSSASTGAVNVFPIPGGHLAAPSTQITFRGVPVSQLGSIVVTGSASGAHAGRVLGDSDGQGGSFLPSRPFTAGETVAVTTGLNIAGAGAGAYSFTVADPAGRIPAAAPRPAPRVKADVDRFASATGLIAPAVKVTRQPARAASGDIFVANQGGPVQYGPMILGPYGGLIWFKPVPKNDTATDFRVQTYRGQPDLTWWQGSVTAAGVGQGEDEIYDSSYRPVATVKAGNGLQSDLHEFQITSANTALVTAYYPVYADATAVKGSKRQIVLDSVAQEIDIPTGLVLYQWDSLDHVPLTDSYNGKPTDPGHPYDYFHINSIQPDTDGNLVVSSRDTWSAYKISHQTGAIMWTLGGKHSTFKMGPHTSFAFQHDARIRAGSEITIFDDGAGPPAVHKQSRGLTLKLDTVHMTATVAGQDEHRPALLAAYEGNVQRQANGDDLIGWGQQPYFTEFDSHGKIVFDARFVDANSSYRAYRFVWNGTPANSPGVAARATGRTTTVSATWNGATGIARWRILGGASATSLKPAASSAKQAFETTIRLPRAERYVATQALDRRGRVLGTSKPFKVS
jgi:hypothetical protein